MADILEQKLPHELVADLDYWGPSRDWVEATVLAPSQTHLMMLGVLAGASTVCANFRGVMPERRTIPQQQGQKLHAIRPDEPGVMQLVVDECVAYKDPDCQGVQRTARLCSTVDDFDASYEAMEQPCFLGDEVLIQTSPGVFTGRSVAYVRGVQPSVLPARLYKDWPHVVVHAWNMRAMADPSKPGVLKPDLMASLVIGQTIFTDRQDAAGTVYSRISQATWLKPGQYSSGERRRLRFSLRVPGLSFGASPA